MTSRKIRTGFFVLFVVSLFLLFAVKHITDKANEELARASAYFPVYLNTPMPEISLTDIEGRNITEEDLTGKVVLLHFWATWCKSCEQELFGISKIQTVEGVRIFCVSVDEKPEDAVNFLKERNLGLTLLFDIEGKAAKKLGSSKFPETYVVSNKKILLKFEGPRNWEDKNFTDFIKKTIESH